MVIRWLLHLWSSRPHSKQEEGGRVNSLKSLLCNSGKGIFPCIFCLHLIGQNWATCPPLAAREAEKWSIFIFWILYRGRISHATLLPHSLSTLPQSMLCLSGAYGSALNHWGPRGPHLEVARSPRGPPTRMLPWSKYCGKLPPNSDLRQQSFLFSLAPRLPRRTVCVQPSKTLHPGEQRKI